MDRVAAIARGHSPEKLIINLWKDREATTFVRSVEVVDSISRVRFSFNGNSTAKSVFAGRALAEIEAIVDGMADRRGMRVLPDLRIDLKDLVLEGCRVVATVAGDGVEMIMIRFVRYFGRVLSLFADGFSQRDCLSESAVDQAITALEQVYMPLRNFSVYLDNLLANFPHLLDREKIAFLRRIREDIQEMGHISDLIVHYVNSQGAVAGSDGTRKPAPFAGIAANSGPPVPRAG